MTPEQAAIRRIIGTRFELAYRMAKLITERHPGGRVCRRRAGRCAAVMAGRQPQLIPRLPRRMKQPRKDVLRQTIRNRDAEIYRLKDELQRLRTPLWRRIVFKFQALRLTSRGS